MDLNRYARRAVASLLENEALTADLDDNAANLLLRWGCDCVYRIVREAVLVGDALTAEEEAIQAAIAPRMRALRRMLRAINLWAAQGDAADPDLPAQIAAHAAVVYGCDLSAMTASAWPATDEQPDQRILCLRQLIEEVVMQNKGEV